MRHRHGPGFSDALAGGPALLEPVSVIVTYATLRVTRILAGAVVVEVPGGAVPPAFAPLRFRPEVDPRRADVGSRPRPRSADLRWYSVHGAGHGTMSVGDDGPRPLEHRADPAPGQRWVRRAA